MPRETSDIEEARKLFPKLPETRTTADDKETWKTELMVVVSDDYHTLLKPSLEQEGGSEYEPPPGGDWRTELWGPDDAAINSRFDDAGMPVRLWTFPLGTDMDRIDARFAGRGVHPNRVLAGAKATNPHPFGAAEPAQVHGVFSANTGPTSDSDIVAVLDTGLPSEWAEAHPSLAAVVNTSVNRMPNDPTGDEEDDISVGHGLFVCGLIHRVAPTVRIRSKRVLRFRIVDDAFLASQLAIREEPVINLSVVTECIGGSPPPIGVRAAIETLAKRGQVIVAAAGNFSKEGGTALSYYPAMFKNVIAVGAYNSKKDMPLPPNEKADFSNFGRYVDVWAPGVGLKSTYLKGETAPASPTGWALWSGTSFATPLVAGTIAKLVKEKAQDDPRLPIDIAEDWLAALGKRVPFGGHGRLFMPANILELTKDS